MEIKKSAKHLAEAMQKLLAVEANLKEDMLDGAVTASDDALVSKIETIRRQIRQEADDVTVESMQQLTTLLRQSIHVITDLVYAKAARGETTKSMAKLQNMLMNIVSGLATNGEDDGDKDRDGFRDDVDIPLVNDEEDDEPDVQQALNQALKHAKKVEDSGVGQAPEEDESEPEAEPEEEPEAKPAPKPAPKKPAPEPEEEEPAAEEEEPSDEGNDEDGGYDNFMSDVIDKDAEEENTGKPKKKAKADEEFSLEDFTFGPEDDDEDAEVPVTASTLVDSVGYVTTAGLRLMYHGLRNIKLGGSKKPVQAIKISIGDNKRDPDNMTAYYYRIDTSAEPVFMAGNYANANVAFLKLLRSVDGYAALSTQINKMVREKKLVIAGRAPVSLAEAVQDDPESFWSFEGIGAHPKNEKKVAIWVELGNKRYALVSKEKLPESELGSISAYLKAMLVGGAGNGGSGTPYTESYELLKQLVTNGFVRGMKNKLKTVFVGDI